ncbi:serine protease gd-like isoform X2 [Chironomus tepperi]|uniref:serine protease gd-like isoform X2 n=1 Tax=Chironomus tepperi TaxID=113505 RepID=UPI00391F4D45
MKTILILTLLLPTIIVAQNYCNSYWTYGRDRNNQLEGFLTIPHTIGYTEHHIQIQLSMGAKLPSAYVGDISLVKDKESAYKDLLNGYAVQYRIRFPIQNPVPKLITVYYNNRIFCSNPNDKYRNDITINLEHNMSVTPLQQSNHNRNKQNNQKYQNTQNSQNNRNTQQAQNIQRNPQQYQTTNRINPFEKNKYEKFAEYNSQCGLPFQKLPESTGLVINGKPAKKGQFPWLAAYYHNGVRESGFICGGSLVSSKAIITAAHCIHYKNDAPKSVEEALFYIGKFFISSLENEKDFIVSPAKRFILHPEWNAYSDSFDADIAIVILSRTIQFTNFVKPICIWTATNDYKDLIGYYGIVAGYGKTSRIDTPSDRPFWTALPVVDEATCLRSNSDFRKITSSRTFCVGSRDGRGPCNGDSGGGFVVRYNNKWYLRGIVSSSLQDKDLFTCDTKNFAVFTDIAAYRDWIIQYL